MLDAKQSVQRMMLPTWHILINKKKLGSAAVVEEKKVTEAFLEVVNRKDRGNWGEQWNRPIPKNGS